jgi:SNF2 family DNA or RNA helicase
MSSPIIKVKDLGSNYHVLYTGNKDDFTPFITTMIKSPGAVKLNSPGWKLPKCYLPELQELYNNQIEMIFNPWDYIGEGMKLSPYVYQKETVHFAIHNPNSLLVLPCGAGKTPIMIALYHEAIKTGLTDKPGIICVKASLKYQWVKEVEKFSDLKAKAIDTPSKAGKKFESQFEDVDLFVLNYETLKNDRVVEKLREKEVEFIACDEIHYVNNHTSDRSKALYQFSDLKIKIGATATPITNNPLNLFGIFNFLKPDIFLNYNKFSRTYIKWAGRGRVAGVKNEEHLIGKIRPFVFIKAEEEIADQLPSLIVNIRGCIMPNKMATVNGRIMEELDNVRMEVEQLEAMIPDPFQLESNEGYQMARAKIMAYQTFAQELVDDPRLLSDSDSSMAKNFVCSDRSPKLDVLLDLIEEITESGDKVCVFTKYERMQRILIEEIEKKFHKKDNPFRVAYVNGTMNPQERYNQAYNLFRDNDEYKVLIGTDAMAEGISLSKCRYLIEYDLADSYAIQTQRHGRVKRADSVHRTSYVYQIVCTDSWDEIQQKIISKKEKYDNSLIKILS